MLFNKTIIKIQCFICKEQYRVHKITPLMMPCLAIMR